MLDNVEIGAITNWSFSVITNLTSLAQGASSPIVPVVQEIPLTGFTISPRVGGIVSPIQEGWYLSYDQGGSNHVVELSVVCFGPQDKNVGVTVSNQSVSISLEWLRVSGSFPY